MQVVLTILASVTVCNGSQNTWNGVTCIVHMQKFCARVEAFI